MCPDSVQSRLVWPNREGDMPRGGHFGEWEEPELPADDIRTFFASISNA